MLELYGYDFAKNFARQLFAYALGRQLQPYDRLLTDQIISVAKQDGQKSYWIRDSKCAVGQIPITLLISDAKPRHD